MTSQNWRTRAGTTFQTEKQSASGSRGVVTSNHPLGSAAGMEILALGGNAIDAAIATLFALNVVEPMMVGIFGAGWMNIQLADGTSVVVDNYATAPQAASADLFTPISDQWPDYMETVGDASKLGYLAAGAPGTLKAWAEAVEQWGRLDLETVIQPAIRYAKQGFRTTQYLSEIITDRQAALAQFPTSAQTFLPNGQPLRAGDLLVQPALADSLFTIAQEGPAVLYGGALGQTIVDDVQANGGILSMDDLRSYQTIRRDSITISYREYEITVPPPPCAGGLHLLQILRILEGFDVGGLGYGTTDSIHLLAECFKIAFADRAAHVGDPDEGVVVPQDWLLSGGYAEERRRSIQMDRATPQQSGVIPSAESGDTTHVTTVDADGNIACLTQTINSTFGSCAMVPGTGILLNNCMALFDPHPGRPNSVAPGKRTTSSMTPAIVSKDGQPVMALGTPGGVRIFTSVLQAIVNVVDHGMTLQEAVEAPRVWTQGQELEIEEGIPDAICHELANRGHTITRSKTIAGGMNGITFQQSSSRESTSLLTGAACWRADGTPIALGGGTARQGIRFRPEAKN